MNRTISKIGEEVVAITVVLFVVYLIVDFLFGSYLVCMILPLGYVMMAAGFQHESRGDRRIAANIGVAFGNDLCGIDPIGILCPGHDRPIGGIE